MKNLINKATTAAAGFIAVLAGFTIAGIGLAAFAFLAMFGLIAVALAVLAAPFASHAVQAEEMRAEDSGEKVAA